MSDQTNDGPGGLTPSGARPMPVCLCAIRGYCADVPGDPLACPVCVHLGEDEPCPADPVIEDRPVPS